MSSSDQIKELALLVNDGLTGYIAVHDTIFRDAASFKSLVKNLFGKGVPMSKLLENSERLVPQWERIQSTVESFRQSSYSGLSTGEKAYFDILSRYVAAVRKTIAALVERQRLAAQGAKGGPNNPMTLEACKQKEQIYVAAVREYSAIGQELNAAAPVIFR